MIDSQSSRSCLTDILVYLYPGWRVGDDSPVTVATAYRWINSAVEAYYTGWKEAESYTLVPVEVQPDYVLTYTVHKNGPALSRESQEIMAPGDYGLYTTGTNPIDVPPQPG